ncbi:MAG TPA: pseudouridine synthase, partial [Gammaproteobacteria bacterium]|nr:pseudouridine synthase [Gammaproteobacteria bacterium]
GSAPVSLPLARERRGGEMYVRVAAGGKAAHSEFRVVSTYGQRATLAEVSLLTGRTHQIRVHAAHLGHPIAGDSRYGDARFNELMRDRGLKRMFLHAHALAFEWPDTGEDVLVSAPLPDDLRAVVDRLSEAGA